MSSKSDPSKSEILLNCLDGRPAPPVVLEGWQQLSAFPRSAWEPFWRLLAPVRMNPGHAANREMIRQFCTAHDISPDGLLAAMGCCELLLIKAAALDLAQDRFQQDLGALTGDGFVETAHTTFQTPIDQRQDIRVID